LRQESNLHAPEVTEPCATGRKCPLTVDINKQEQRLKNTGRGTKRQRNKADVLSLDYAIRIAAGFEPAFSAPEVSVAYATGLFLPFNQ